MYWITYRPRYTLLTEEARSDNLLKLRLSKLLKIFKRARHHQKSISGKNAIWLNLSCCPLPKENDGPVLNPVFSCVRGIKFN